jgi:hypothetical protein
MTGILPRGFLASHDMSAFRILPFTRSGNFLVTDAGADRLKDARQTQPR